jgi:FkbM family methyltransferase
MCTIFEHLRRAIIYPFKFLRCMACAEVMRYLCAWICGVEVIWVRPRGFRTKVAIRPHTTDIRVFYELFGLHEMDFDWPIKCAPQTVIDAGANIGYATVAIKARWPQATVLALEPDAGNFSILTKNCRELQGVQPARNGLWGKCCELDVREASVSKGAWALSFFPSGSHRNGVSAITVSDAIAMIGGDHCDLLKIDIEGAEESVLSENVESWIYKVSVVLIEVHGNANQLLLADFIARYGWKSRRAGEKHLLWREHDY